MRHFHEKLKEEHQIGLSYTSVKEALQGAGLGARGWFQDERWYDLIVTLDDANGEIYYAWLVEEESTVTVMAGLEEMIVRKGYFALCKVIGGSHFWITPTAGGPVDKQQLTQVGLPGSPRNPLILE